MLLNMAVLEHVWNLNMQMILKKQNSMIFIFFLCQNDYFGIWFVRIHILNKVK